MRQCKYILRGEEHTLCCGRELAALARPRLRVYLEGELGAGKTTLARGFMLGLGHRGAVTSPTYTMVDEYVIPGLTVYHMDLYRTSADDFHREWPELSEYFAGDGLCLLEWPERGAAFLPEADVTLRLEHVDSASRSLTASCADAGLTQAMAAGLSSCGDGYDAKKPV